jgi:hypothetical protein
MTIDIKISVNGNYKCPVNFKQGDREESLVVSGFGRDTPNEVYIPFYHGPDALSLTVGPEEQDNGETDTP